VLGTVGTSKVDQIAFRKELKAERVVIPCRFWLKLLATKASRKMKKPWGTFRDRRSVEIGDIWAPRKGQFHLRSFVDRQLVMKTEFHQRTADLQQRETLTLRPDQGSSSISAKEREERYPSINRNIRSRKIEGALNGFDRSADKKTLNPVKLSYTTGREGLIKVKRVRKRIPKTPKRPSESF